MEEELLERRMALCLPCDLVSGYSQLKLVLSFRDSLNLLSAGEEAGVEMNSVLLKISPPIGRC